MISFLFFTFPFFQNGEVKIKKLKTKMEKLKIKTKSLCRALGLRRLVELSEEEVGLTLPVFLRKLLNTNMPCD